MGRLTRDDSSHIGIAFSSADANLARLAAGHLADSGVGTGTTAMRTTSSMQPRLSTAVVPKEPTAVLGMGASAQTQSGR
jgi:hypothetical protein